MADGVRLEVGIDDGGLGHALQRAIALGGDLKEGLTLSGDILEQSTRNRFDTGAGPGGIPWPVSRRAQVQGGKTLVDKGGLLGSIRTEVRANEVEVGSAGVGQTASKAYVHQFGATIVPKKGPFLVFTGADGGLVFARSVTIPARPFVGIDDQDIADLEDAWTGVLQGAFDGN